MRNIYSCEVFYTDGSSERYRLVQHFYDKTFDCWMFCTEEDLWVWLFPSNIKNIKWDKDWSKIVASKQKQPENKNAN